MRTWTAAAVASWVLFSPSIAGAACQSVFSCYCSPDALAVVTGTVTNADGTMEVATIEPQDAMVDFAVGDEVTGYGSVDVGDNVWTVVNATGAGQLLSIEGSAVACFGNTDPVDMQVATNAALGMSCQADLEAAGLSEPPCNDGNELDDGDGDTATDAGCSVASGPSPSDDGLGWLAAAGLALAHLRHRRARPITRAGATAATPSAPR